MKIYQIRHDGGDSADFWPDATNVTFEGCKKSLQELLNKWFVDDEQALKRVNLAIQNMRDEPDKAGIIYVPWYNTWFVHVIEAGE